MNERMGVHFVKVWAYYDTDEGVTGQNLYTGVEAHGLEEGFCSHWVVIQPHHNSSFRHLPLVVQIIGHIRNVVLLNSS